MRWGSVLPWGLLGDWRPRLAPGTRGHSHTHLGGPWTACELAYPRFPGSSAKDTIAALTRRGPPWPPAAVGLRSCWCRSGCDRVTRNGWAVRQGQAWRRGRPARGRGSRAESSGSWGPCVRPPTAHRPLISEPPHSLPLAHFRGGRCAHWPARQSRESPQGLQLITRNRQPVSPGARRALASPAVPWSGRGGRRPAKAARGPADSGDSSRQKGQQDPWVRPPGTEGGSPPLARGTCQGHPPRVTRMHSVTQLVEGEESNPGRPAQPARRRPPCTSAPHRGGAPGAHGSRLKWGGRRAQGAP